MATQKTSSKPSMTMAELMATHGSKVQPLKKGDIVSGTVKKLTPREILLDINGKSDALVLEYDKKNMENLLRLLKVGDTVKASVISAESEEGFPVVSLRRMLDDLIYEQLDDVFANNKEVTVMISDQGRGGYFATTDGGIRGFLPNSQVMGEEELSGKTISAKVIELNKQAKRVIFSQKALHYVTDPTQMAKHVKEGATVKGEISAVSPYGVYVNIMPADGVTIEGFIHISEVSHQRVDSMAGKFAKGDKVEAFVLGIDGENRRVNLSLKKLAKDAFEDALTKYPKEQKVKGTVTEVKSRGVTIQLEDGIFGFIPNNKIESSTKYAVGETVEAEVADHDAKRRLVMLSPVLKAIPVSYR